MRAFLRRKTIQKGLEGHAALAKPYLAGTNTHQASLRVDGVLVPHNNDAAHVPALVGKVQPMGEVGQVERELFSCSGICAWIYKIF